MLSRSLKGQQERERNAATSRLLRRRSWFEAVIAMKFVEHHPLADPDAAARKLIEIANGVEAAQDGRIYIERVNEPFLTAGGSGEQFRAGIERAIALGWLWRHESGTYVRFTDKGAELFA